MIEKNELDFKKLLHLAHAHNLGDSFLPFWAGMLSEVLCTIKPTTNILELGSTNTKFLQFIRLAYPYHEGLGVILDVDNIDASEIKADDTCRFISESMLDSEERQFDIAFSHEIFSLVSNIHLHAETAWHHLAPDGVYYAAFGWHKDNPCSSRQAKLRSDRNLPFYLYQLDYIAATFYEMGFEVGYKRLAIPYFMVYDPQVVNRRFGGVADMITSLQDHKVLFSFRKEKGEHGQR
ncbi:MAG: hypothetical protein WCH01_01010 [Methylococcaceae bacterium]